MPAATSTAATSRPSAPVKMEDRKRPAVGTNDDMAPPTKRQAVNGGGRAKDDAGDSKEEAWIEEYAKGAIYRQMLEYKRQVATLENRLEKALRRAADHDDHLRIIDGWWLQLAQEVSLLVEGAVQVITGDTIPLSFSKVTFKDLDEFNKHLDDKGTSIKSKLESLLNKIAGGRLQVTPSVASLEANIAALLAAQKDMMNKIERLTAQEAELNEELDKAILRSMRAEKKLDRLKSAQVQKMEQQATASATTNAGKDKVENGADAGKSSGEYEALAAKFEETRALAEKEREQRDAALAQAKVLQEELTALKIKLSSLGDDDYVRSDVFKQFKSQNEDLIRRINHLEATNRLLREEADKLQAERTAYRTQLNREMQAVTADLEDQIQQRDQDLTRIRSARDELLSDVSQRKAQLEQERTSLEHMKELVQAKEDRIAALELERQRLDSQGEQTAPEGRADIDQLSREQLYEKYVKLERDYESIMKEMPFIEQAYRKMAALSQKKVMDFGALEERVSILIAEKAKADQKYFAVRKDTDTRNAEIRALRIQNGKSSEIISQLKDVEAQNRTLLSNLEKQLTDMKQATSTTMAENKRLEATATDAVRRSEALKQQLNELTALLKEKDAQNMSTVERKMALEAEVEQARIRLDHAQKERDMWKQRCHSTEDKDLSYIKAFAQCSICRLRWKNSFLRTCGHLFCRECLDDRISNRLRKCPNCGKAFDKSDILAAHM